MRCCLTVTDLKSHISDHIGEADTIIPNPEFRIPHLSVSDLAAEAAVLTIPFYYNTSYLITQTFFGIFP